MEAVEAGHNDIGIGKDGTRACEVAPGCDQSSDTCASLA
jgi:hypothetical protein